MRKAQTTTVSQPEQVGGTHYKDTAGHCPHCDGEIQHWDLVADQPYLPSQVSKYTGRFAQKGKMEDLYKALSYLQKLILTETAKLARQTKSGTLSHTPVRKRTNQLK